MEAAGYPDSAALLAVADSGNTAAVITLISAGTDVNAANKSGDTPLHVAALEGNTETVVVLMDAGADIEAANYDVETVLDQVDCDDEPEATGTIQIRQLRTGGATLYTMVPRRIIPKQLWSLSR